MSTVGRLGRYAACASVRHSTRLTGKPEVIPADPIRAIHSGWPLIRLEQCISGAANVQHPPAPNLFDALEANARISILLFRRSCAQSTRCSHPVGQGLCRGEAPIEAQRYR